MMPTLYMFTLLTAIVLATAGLPLLVAARELEQRLRDLPRNVPLGVFTMLLGGGWFLWKISQLGQADFGDYKVLLFILFAATLVGSLLYVRDFLAVRGLAILVLLSANVGLKTAFGEYDIPQRIPLVLVLYIAIVLAIWAGIAPYVGRDWLAWLYKDQKRVRWLGGLLTGTGALLAVLAFTY
jgi:hypothetical protein